jgi:hypothetical protein
VPPLEPGLLGTPAHFWNKGKGGEFTGTKYRHLLPTPPLYKWRVNMLVAGVAEESIESDGSTRGCLWEREGEQGKG